MNLEPKMRRPNTGFTLIELLMVISIMSITFMAIPAFMGWQSILRTNAATRGVASDLRLARSLAVDRNHDMVVTYDLANNSYSLYSDADGDGPEVSELEKTVSLASYGAGVMFGTLSGFGVGGGTITSSVMLDNPTTPLMILLRGNGEAIHFGSIYLVNQSDLAPGKIDRNRAIQILNTGNVRTFRFNGANPSDPWSEFY